MPRSEKMRIESRERILKAAMTLFVRKGFHDTTTREITELAGISKGLLYNYFGSKEAILCGIIEARAQNLTAVIASCKVEADPAATIARLVRAYCQMLRLDREYLRFRTALVLQPGIPEAVTSLITQRVAEMFDAICALLAAVGIPDAQRAGYVLMARLEGMGVHYMGILENYPLDEIENATIQDYENKYP